MADAEIIVGECSVQLVQGDITRIAVDAIVNAANPALSGGGGVDGAMHAAGGPTLMNELRRYSGCPTGSAVATTAGRLPAKYVFHAVGPVYRGGHQGEGELLAACYRTALQMAQERGCQSISFPAISTGIYGYPMKAAAGIAWSAVTEWLLAATGPVRVVKLVQFSDSSYDIYGELMRGFQARHLSAQTS